MSPFLQDEGNSHISHIFNFHQLLKHEISTKFPFPVFKFGVRGRTSLITQRNRMRDYASKRMGEYWVEQKKTYSINPRWAWTLVKETELLIKIQDYGSYFSKNRQTWVLIAGTGTPAHLGPSWDKWGCQLLAVLQGKGRNLESRKGWGGRKREESVTVSLLSSYCHHISLLVKNL